MLPTQRTALVEITRWSWIIIASAPPRHIALTTACTSCWWMTRSSAVNSPPKLSTERVESVMVTVREGPVAPCMPAARSRVAARWVIARSRESAGALRVLSVST